MPLFTTFTRSATALAMLSALGACATMDDVTTRNAAFEPTLAPVQAVVKERLRIVDYTVDVPASLVVSEANAYYPKADIVWRADPMGDRRAQVAKVLERSIQQSAAQVTEGRPVSVELRLRRFHSVTEKTRATMNGTHSIRFDLITRDAETKAILRSAENIDASFPAYGGTKAKKAEARGQTQQVRIIGHLGALLRAEMGQPALAPQAPAVVAAQPQGSAVVKGQIGG